MHLRDWSAALATLVVGAGLIGWIGQVVGQQPALQLSAPQNGGAGANGGGGVMEDGTAITRGPIHEAFAEVINYNPEPTIVVDKRPPGAIEELPPDQKPEGEGHLWIPGYWAWAEDRNDYIWISGVWTGMLTGRCPRTAPGSPPSQAGIPSPSPRRSCR